MLSSLLCLTLKSFQAVCMPIGKEDDKIKSDTKILERFTGQKRQILGSRPLLPSICKLLPWTSRN